MAKDRLPKVPSRRNDREVRNIERVAAGGTPSKGCALTVLSLAGSAVLGVWRAKGWVA